MVGLELLTGHLHAVATLAIMAAEALVLYVGYGIGTGVAIPVVEQVIKGD